MTSLQSPRLHDQCIEDVQKQVASTRQETESSGVSGQDVTRGDVVKGLLQQLAERDKEVVRLRAELENALGGSPSKASASTEHAENEQSGNHGSESISDLSGMQKSHAKASVASSTRAFPVKPASALNTVDDPLPLGSVDEGGADDGAGGRSSGGNRRRSPRQVQDLKDSEERRSEVLQLQEAIQKEMARHRAAHHLELSSADSAFALPLSARSARSVGSRQGDMRTEPSLTDAVIAGLRQSRRERKDDSECSSATTVDLHTEDVAVDVNQFMPAGDDDGRKELRRRRYERQLEKRNRSAREHIENGSLGEIRSLSPSQSAIDNVPGTSSSSTAFPADQQVGSPARGYRDVLHHRREFAPPIKAAAANAAAIAAAAANAAMAAVSAAKQERCQLQVEPRHFLPQRQRALGHASPPPGVIEGRFVQSSSQTKGSQRTSPRAPRGSPRSSPRPQASPRPDERASNEEIVHSAASRAPGAEGTQSGPSPRSPSIAVPSAMLRSKFTELRDEMKRRRSATSPSGGRSPGRSTPAPAKDNMEDDEIAIPGAPPARPNQGTNNGIDAREQATRLCPPFLERGRPAPQVSLSERGSAAATARELTRKDQVAVSHQVQSSRTGQSRSPRPSNGGSYVRGRGSPKCGGGEVQQQGGRSSPSSALWRCSSARRVSGSNANSKRPVPPISGLLQLRQPTNAPGNSGGRSGSMASVAGAALSASLAGKESALSPEKDCKTTRSSVDAEEIGEENVNVDQGAVDEASPSNRKSNGCSHSRVVGSRLDTGGTSSAASISGNTGVVPATSENPLGCGSVTLSTSGSATYSIGGGSVSLLAAPGIAGPLPSARQRLQSPPPLYSPSPADHQHTFLVSSPLSTFPTPSSTSLSAVPPLSAVAAATAAMSTSATPQPSPRASVGGMSSPRAPTLEENNTDLLHQAVLQFSRQRPAGRPPLIRVKHGVYLHGNKTISLVLKSGRLMARFGNNFVPLSEAVLASLELGGVSCSGYETPIGKPSSVVGAIPTGHGSITLSASACMANPQTVTSHGAMSIRLVNRNGV